jgi:hypothetical protein
VAAKKFGAANKSSVSCSTVRENFRNLPTKATQIHRNRISFSRAAKAFGICQQKRLKLIAFTCSKKFGIDCVLCSRAAKEKATHIDCISFSRAAKNFGSRTNTRMDWILFYAAPSDISGICEHKQLKASRNENWKVFSSKRTG